jgi:hypothetical protein
MRKNSSATVSETKLFYGFQPGQKLTIGAANCDFEIAQ